MTTRLWVTPDNQNVAWSDPQADGYGDKRRVRRPWDV